MSMNLIKNSSRHVQNTIRVVTYCIAVLSTFLFYEIHPMCHCMYVTVRTKYHSSARVVWYLVMKYPTCLVKTVCHKGDIYRSTSGIAKAYINECCTWYRDIKNRILMCNLCKPLKYVLPTGQCVCDDHRWVKHAGRFIKRYYELMCAAMLFVYLCILIKFILPKTARCFFVSIAFDTWRLTTLRSCRLLVFQRWSCLCGSDVQWHG